MCIRQQDIEAILAFLPVFEGPEFRAYEGMSGGEYQWHSDVERFHSALYDHRWVFNFDWSEWQEEAEKILGDEGILNAADIETLRKLLTTIARKERFCANVLPLACGDGTMVRILRRLHELHEGEKAG